MSIGVLCSFRQEDTPGPITMQPHTSDEHISILADTGEVVKVVAKRKETFEDGFIEKLDVHVL